MSGPTEPGDVQARFMRLLGGKWVTAAVAAAAELGVAEPLVDGPRSVEQLARTLDCDGDRLARLVRVLCAEGLLLQLPSREVELTELGQLLRKDRLGPLARMVGAPFMWDPWSRLAAAVRGGGASPFEALMGTGLFEHLDEDVQDAGLYHAGVDAFTRAQAAALATAREFVGAPTVVDLGGGMGTLLVELKRHWPDVDACLFDRESVVARAQQLGEVQAAGIRCHAGNLFSGALPQADVFVIKHVLHNWDDERCVSLLQRCRGALRPGGSVLVIEGLLLPGNVPDGTALLDLEMMCLLGEARERSKPEFRRLFGQAGLKLASARALTESARLLVVEPR